MNLQYCRYCLFCEEFTGEMVLCTNADLALDTAWEDIYLSQGFLELTTQEEDKEPCFWYVPRS